MSFDQIGQKLKSARDLSGLSLAQIQEKTKIPYNHLSSIDLGNFDDLPEPVYVSGFIRRYAECVGLDPQELVAEYRSEIDKSAEPPKKTGLLFKSKKNNNGNNLPAQANYYNRQRMEKSAPNLFKLVPFYALWIILILGLIVYLVNRQGEIEQNQQDPGLLTLKQSASTILPTKALQSNPADVTSTQMTNSNTVEQDNALNKDLYRVTVKAKNHVWLEVKAVSNGEALFNGFIESGDRHDFSDKEGLRITAINGSVSVLASGKTSEFGTAGKTTEKIFSGTKVSQVAESQTGDDSSEPVITKTNSSSAPVSTAQNPISPKKPVSDTAMVKKAAISSMPATKPHFPKENMPIHEAVAPNAEPGLQSPTNKAIDVPYRYSE